LFVSGQLLVQFLPNITNSIKQKIHSQMGTTVLEEEPYFNIDLVSVSVGKEDEYKNKYMNFNEVIAADLNHLRFPAYRPNDPFYLTPTITQNDGLQSQWGLRRVNPEGAWDVAHTIREEKIIAILDTGIDPRHPDLASKIIFPANFAGDPDYIDNDGHGTHVAGIAAAVTDNLTGVAGMSFNTARIIPVKVLGPNQNAFSVTNGIAWAILNNANVISMSLTGPAYNLIEQNIVNIAWNRGIVVVAAVGNDNSPVVVYPAGYNHVLAVAATDQNNNRANFGGGNGSNFGVDVGIAAPGVAILSTTPTFPPPAGYLPNYDALQGTSQATPFVSGLAVMLMAAFPELSNIEVVQIIQQSARPLGNPNNQKEWNQFFGYGLLDASAAFELAAQYIAQRRLSSSSSHHRSSSSHRSHPHPPGPPHHRSHRRSSSSSHHTSRPFRFLRGLGSFYGQVVDINGNAIAGATVSAISIQTGQILTQFGPTGADGMFRLANLPRGSYTVQAQFGATISQQDVTIVPGADVYLQIIV
jgi:thermitase